MRDMIIVGSDGTRHIINPDTMLASIDRAKKYLPEAVRWSAEREAQIEAAGDRDHSRHDKWMERNQFPEGVWFPIESSFNAEDKATVLKVLRQWTKGTLEDFTHAYVQLEDQMDLDATYILFGVPIQEASEQREKLLKFGASFGARNVSAVYC